MESLRVESSRSEKRFQRKLMVPVTEEEDNPPGFSKRGAAQVGLSSSRVKVHPLRRPSQAKWTDKEDRLLAKVVNSYQAKSWGEIAKCMSGRTYKQCLQRWKYVVNPALNKGRWTKEDDNRLMKLVEEHGPNNWSHIATFFTGRMGKQCRERWNSSLNPAIKRGGWTKEEEDIITRCHAQYGNRWTQISGFLPGRNGDSVRSYWNCKRKSKRKTHEIDGQVSRISLADMTNIRERPLIRDSCVASGSSDKRLVINDIRDRPLIEDALFRSFANVENDQIGRRYVPPRPSGFSRSVPPHLRSSFCRFSMFTTLGS